MTTWNEKMLVDAQKLVKLLEDPHPGLFTWNMAVSDVTDRLNNEYKNDDMSGGFP